MSELDIEYKGIGGGRQIAIGTEQCFRDHSSIDSTVSLVDDEQELYSRPVPTFLYASHRSLARSVSREYLEVPVAAGSSTVPSTLNRDALFAMEQSILPRQEHEISPLARYRHDLQSHEQLALGIKLGEMPTWGIPSSPPTGTQAETRYDVCGPTAISSLRLSPTPSTTPAIETDVSSADKLRELLDVIESPRWENDMSPEDQLECLRRITILKRRVRSETNPRESRPTKVRKRNHHYLNSSKDQRSSSS
ncbi:hypothetical protein F4819DRAFT_491672 [Hypoxylon fuscum]|nr:hypothetical protein F4819DRAFT_491672 [Hypoxylon fuscum]